MVVSCTPYLKRPLFSGYFMKKIENKHKKKHGFLRQILPFLVEGRHHTQKKGRVVGAGAKSPVCGAHFFSFSRQRKKKHVGSTWSLLLSLEKWSSRK